MIEKEEQEQEQEQEEEEEEDWGSRGGSKIVREAKSIKGQSERERRNVP